MSHLSVENLKIVERPFRRSWFRYDFEERGLIDDLSFSVERGESLGIVGEEKSGKKALVEAILKLREVESGSIVFAEVETTRLGRRHFRRLRKRMPAVFPDGDDPLTPEWTVDAMFREARQLWYAGETREQWHQRIESVMVLCELPEAVRVLYPSELDAVERQQVALARALLVQPEFLLVFDYTRGLDVVQEAELLNLLRKVREELRITMLVVTDDLAVAHQLSDAIGVLHAGRLLEIGPAEAIVNRPEHDYTRRLVSCSL